MSHSDGKAAQMSQTEERRQWLKPGRPGTDSSSVIVQLSCDLSESVFSLKFWNDSIIQGGCEDPGKKYMNSLRQGWCERKCSIDSNQ